ncbi:Mov34/MPN/PAD-1 family protein [Baekduia sp. Peel2402]|uniref:Mov34/MPN/PAD-1 family protein n=1 Tax=Baekduia sp. Peel2402 TaxID=3458296 RepID=UPI00403EBE05
MGTQLVAAGRFHGRTVNAGLPVRPRPIGSGWHVWRTADGRSAIVAEGVVAVIRAVERDESPQETGGILFGRGFRDWAGEYVLVTHAERPHRGEVLGTVSTVAITAEGAAAMGRRAQQAQPVADVVGWYHTHPSYAAYFSDVDRAEQRRWPSPLAIGLVMSGRDDAEPRYSVFVGPESAATVRPPAGPAPAAELEVMDLDEFLDLPDRVGAPEPDPPPGLLPRVARRRRLAFALTLMTLVLVELAVIVVMALPSGTSEPVARERPSGGAGPFQGALTAPQGPGFTARQGWFSP